MEGFKGFDKNLKCRDFQYEIGGTYEHDGALSLCASGFHFCENPLDVFTYYTPADSRFAKVTGENVSDQKESDSKRVAAKLQIGAELSLTDLCNAGAKFILDRADFKNAKESNTGNYSAATNTGDWSAATNTGNQSAATNTGNQSAATNTGNQSAATNTGDQSAATNTGYRSAATNTGYRSAATNTGYRSAATNTGKNGWAISLGIGGRAKGAVGCWLTLAEWKNGEPVNTVTKRIDGKRIKADTFYTLENGKFVKTS
jgi:hypothetical protein